MKHFRRPISSPPHSQQKGFGLIELLFLLTVASFVSIAIINLTVHIDRMKAPGADLREIENLRHTLVAKIHDPRSWMNTLFVANETGNPLPFLTPPSPVPVGFGNLVDIYDSGWNLAAWSTRPDAGFTPRGEICTGFQADTPTPACPFRFEVRWYSPSVNCFAPNCNPIVNFTLSLRVSRGTYNVQPFRFSFDNNFVESTIPNAPPLKPRNPVSRQMNLSWVSYGLTTNNPKLQFLNIGGIAGCVTGTVPGILCANPGAACVCPQCMTFSSSGCCPNGNQVLVCQ